MGSDMSRWVKPMGVLLAVLASAFGPETPSDAHPHAWIDLRSAVVLDQDSKVTGIRVYWIFDEFYTLFTLEAIDPDRDGNPEPELVRGLAEENLKNLADYAYFTYVKVDGRQPDYGTVEDYDSYLEGDRLIMEFVVPLVEPVDPRAQDLSYAVYDPTYYIEIFHVDARSFTAEGPIPEGCALELEEPNPNPEMVSFASSLDQTESAGDGLGAFFAEQVHLRC
jgi:ABC-type uncharacterized transport system substrate-binding protein